MNPPEIERIKQRISFNRAMDDLKKAVRDAITETRKDLDDIIARALKDTDDEFNDVFEAHYKTR